MNARRAVVVVETSYESDVTTKDRGEAVQHAIELGVGTIGQCMPQAPHDRVTQRGDQHDRIVVGVLFDEVTLESPMSQITLAGLSYHGRDRRKKGAVWIYRR